MKFGLTDQQFKLLNELAIKPLTDKKAKLFIFGSRARGTHHPYSDIDLLYKENSANPINDLEISKIKDDLENSNLPFKVDLVNDKNLAASYRASVEKDMIVLMS